MKVFPFGLFARQSDSKGGIMIKSICTGLFLAAILLPAAVAFAQNGKLIELSTISVLEQVEIKSITYMSDNLKVKGYMAIPKKGEKLPCVIWNRGGNGNFGSLNDKSATLNLGTIASWGYIVVASQYRGNGGGEGKEEYGGNDVNDILNLIPLLESMPRADTTRIGMYGVSRGGMMTYIALTRTDRITAAIVNSGLSDLIDWVKWRPEMENVYSSLIPDFRKNREAALTARSAVKWPEKIPKNIPILLLHGSADWRVHPDEAFAMANALYQVKHPLRFVFFEGAQHGLSEYTDEVNRIAKDWLDRYVRDRKSWPSLEPHGG
jgi:dipeptidyl aminopeptidase/acylaminoacyl peptidase